VAVRIKLKRLGKIRSPHYRIVVADARTRRDGRAIEEIGLYHPVQNPSRIEVDSERVQYWLGVGAQPTDSVKAILQVTGDWQKFRGLPAPPPMKVAEARPDRRAVFEAAAKESGGEPRGEAITPKAKKSQKADKSDKPEKGEKAEKSGEKKADAEAASQPSEG
jgi:small subunit ribosomal protein S16